MSYDYHLLRLREPAACLNDLTAGRVVAGDWYEEARALLRTRFPELTWRDDASGHRGDGGHLGLGRLEVALLRGDPTSVLVHGSHHADQRAFVLRLAAALGATAFDCQTGRALAPE